MLSCYLALPDKQMREDFLWCTRTVVEKVKTDQRSRALELLCLGYFQRGGALWPLVTNSDWRLKAGSARHSCRRSRSRLQWREWVDLRRRLCW